MTDSQSLLSHHPSDPAPLIISPFNIGVLGFSFRKECHLALISAVGFCHYSANGFAVLSGQGSIQEGGSSV